MHGRNRPVSVGGAGGSRYRRELPFQYTPTCAPVWRFNGRGLGERCAACWRLHLACSLVSAPASLEQGLGAREILLREIGKI
jgi:hypothetical protein